MNDYALSGLHCDKCVARITKSLHGKIATYAVSLSPPRLSIHGEQPDLTTLNSLLQSAGDYTAAPLTQQQAAQPQTAQGQSTATAQAPGMLETYRPLFLIAGFLVLVATLTAETTGQWMQYFMAGFFLVFAFFKFLNLDGFAQTYARYDLLAAYWKPYGYIYPFIELALGVLYLTNTAPYLTNLFTLALMLFSGAGVLDALRQKKVLQCACLGTTVTLPVGVATLVENFGMAAMAAMMVLGLHP